MVEFRKSRGGRRFIRINGEYITEVINTRDVSTIFAGLNEFKLSTISEDMTLVPCTEAEFNLAYKVALAVIQMQKI